MPRTTLLLLVYSLLSLVSSEDISLHIAVVPPWSKFFNEVIVNSNLSFKIYTTEVSVNRSKSEFDQLIQVNEKLEKNDIHAVLGPFEPSVALVTEKQRIPYISTSAVDKTLTSVFQLVPPLSGFSDAFVDMIKHNGWKKISLFYDDDNGSHLVEKLVSYQDLELVKSWRLRKNEYPLEIRKDLLRMRTSLIQKTIILCSKENTLTILDQARSLAMLTTPYIWYFYDPGLGMESVFDEFPDVAVNFTLFGLLQYDSAFLSKENQKERLNKDGSSDSLALLNKALAYDSLAILNMSVSNIEENTVPGIRRGIYESLQQVKAEGITSNIQFDQYGQRYDYAITLTEVTDSLTYQDIGKWMSHPAVPKERFEFKSRLENNRTLQFPLKGRTVRIVTILEKPFTMLKRDHLLRVGNDRFHGYAIDLIREIAKMLKFEYVLYLVNDGKFGSRLDNGEWNGMIGEILAGNATMTIAPLSISAEREEAVDFTKPFMSRYINVIMKAPEIHKSYFDFLNPLHPVVWFCTFGAFFIVSIILYILEKFSNKNKNNNENICIRECFWFMFGSLLHSSTERCPSTLSGRTLTSFWWFFALILVSSYTANLAAFLTVKKINSPINSVTDLASQSKIKYGTVESSGVLSFFKRTKIQHFAKMGAQMIEVDPSVLVQNTSEGFKRVKGGNYAFFWDSTVNSYMTVENCDLMEIGPPFAPKGFGIAVPPGAVYREELSMTLLRLSDLGTLNTLENKWWGRSNCPDVTKPSADETSELQIENVAGIFFILGSGIALALLVCVAQYTFRFLFRSEKEQQNKYLNDFGNSM